MTTPLEKVTRELLRADAAGLDGPTSSRLNRARQAALDELAPQGRSSRTPFLPLAAAAGAALVAVWLLPHQGAPAVAPPAAVAAIDDADLVGADGPGLLDEDPTLFALAAVDGTAP